jgi:hypothetical protein
LAFDCTSAIPAPIFPGLNTFLVSATATAIPDMLSIAKTATNDGNIVFPPGSSQQAMATATINIGAAGAVTFTPTDTPFGQPLRVLPLVLSICQTDPTTGACLSAPTPVRHADRGPKSDRDFHSLCNKDHDDDTL